MFVQSSDPPGVIRAVFPFPLDDIPHWHSSDDTVVTITSVALDGTYCLVDWGRHGNAVISVVARASNGQKVVGETRVFVERGIEQLLPLVTEVMPQ